MKEIKCNALLQQWQYQIKEAIAEASILQTVDEIKLNTQPTENAWSVTQIIEHLNIYCRYYINAVEQKLHVHQTKAATHFKPGWLGNYFTKLMQPKANNTIAKKMKAPKNAQPLNNFNAKEVLQEFINHQHQLLNLIQIAQGANLNTIRIPTSLNKFIALKLGDTFAFFIAHQQRHFIQIKNTVELTK